MSVNIDNDSLNINVEDTVKKQVNQLIDQNMEYLVAIYIFPEIHRIATATNMPPMFAEHVGFERTAPNAGKVINKWGTKEKPLALWFNYGTKDHGPVKAFMLHWKDKNGDDIWAHWVRGIRASKAMDLGIEIGLKRLKEDMPKFIQERLR